MSHDYGYDMPARFPAGLIHLRLVNRGPDIHEAMVIRFNAAGSAAGYVDSVRADVDFPAFAEDMVGPLSPRRAIPATPTCGWRRVTMPSSAGRGIT
ncbi:MAG: hypothetical protein ABI836_04265 [Gemmatimonadota bacterium]